jgi:hypothetical protein
MFFICDSGETTSGKGTENGKFCLWRDDNFIFFADNGGHHSFQIEDDELEEFCKFLIRGSNDKDYVEFKPEKKGEPYIALEEDDEGERNLCIFDKRTCLMFYMKTSVLYNMAMFLRKRIKKTEENVQCTLF